MFKYSIDKLHQILKSLPDSEGYLIAFSGGMDSHVLLKSLVELEDELSVKITAVHVNHGLSLNAKDWAVYCQNICDSLRVELEIIEIDARCPKGESPESWARLKRYEVLSNCLGPGQILLTAHHKDDQGETLLLQLFRGAGPGGLSGMPVTKGFAKGWHCRPLLGFSRDQLKEYALACDLDWVEDESNQDIGLDRNYIRHQLIPVIKQHWPGLTDTLSRAANHQAEASDLQVQLANLDLVINTDDTGLKLSMVKLIELPLMRQKNLIRYWLQTLKLPLPDTKSMQHIIHDVIYSKHDAMPCVSWNGAEIRRYRDHIYASAPLTEHDPEQTTIWNLDTPIHITHGKLTATLEIGKGIKASLCQNNCLEIRYRCGGEVIRPAGRIYHHELKKLLQDQAVPPWLRDRIPLLYIDGKFAAVAGKWIDTEYFGSEYEECWHINWEGIGQIFPD